MDTELFELCKEVYKLFPKWEDKTLRAFNYDGRIINPPMAWQEPHTPLYTSDYLLEKLQRPDLIAHFEQIPITGDLWYVEMQHANLNGIASTFLKALLKLTLALHEAGELPQDTKLDKEKS